MKLLSVPNHKLSRNVCIENIHWVAKSFVVAKEYRINICHDNPRYESWGIM